MTQKHPKLYRCTIPGICVRSNEGGKVFAVEELVDMDALTPTGETWRQALGELAATFVLVDSDLQPSEE